RTAQAGCSKGTDGGHRSPVHTQRGGFYRRSAPYARALHAAPFTIRGRPTKPDQGARYGAARFAVRGFTVGRNGQCPPSAEEPRSRYGIRGPARRLSAHGL